MRALFSRFRRSSAFALLAGVTASIIGTTIALSVAAQGVDLAVGKWSVEEREMIRSLALASLPALPADPSNKFADDARAAALGERLFSDARLSANGKVSCATCHVAARDFQDGIALAKGVGTTSRRTMPIAGTAYSPWMFWDGRADSQWSQALGPLESAVEHGGTRAQYAHVIAEYYGDVYEPVFGKLPSVSGIPKKAGPVGDDAARASWRGIPAARQSEISRVYANIGKAIAAFERRIGFSETKFDRWVQSELSDGGSSGQTLLTRDEVAGLRLFIGKASCVNCHNGPRFTDDHFHNTGVSAVVGLPPDSGRTTGVAQVLRGEFNCLSTYSDAKPADCGELLFATAEGSELLRAYKTPSLRGVAERAPFMHAGQFGTLAEVLDHYNRAPRAVAGHSELKALKLSATERRQIESFLRTLSSARIQ